MNKKKTSDSDYDSDVDMRGVDSNGKKQEEAYAVLLARSRWARMPPADEREIRTISNTRLVRSDFARR